MREEGCAVRFWDHDKNYVSHKPLAFAVQKGACRVKVYLNSHNKENNARYSVLVCSSLEYHSRIERKAGPLLSLGGERVVIPVR